MCDTFAQVDFEDSSGSSDISAVQVDHKSSYMAEYTSFTGFDGEVCLGYTRSLNTCLLAFPLQNVLLWNRVLALLLHRKFVRQRRKEGHTVVVRYIFR